jgi:hypothetical protein
VARPGKAGSSAVPVVDAHPDLPTGQVDQADVDVDPILADIEPGRIDRRLAPLPQLATDLRECGIQGQAGLPADVEVPVTAPLEQDDHPRPWTGSSNTWSSRPS